MKNKLGMAAGIVLVCGAVIQAQGQSATINFTDGTDDGFGLKFSNDASANFTIVNVAGNNMMQVPRSGAFQEADRGTGNTSDPFFVAMNAAAQNAASYTISYDWRIDTSTGNFGTFLQVGTYINAGSGAYAQDFGAVKEVELNSTQLASGQVFSGTFTGLFDPIYGTDLTAFQTQTFLRFGFILNGDGTAANVDFDNITIAPVVPEPSTYALFAMGAPALWMMRRRFSARR